MSIEEARQYVINNVIKPALQSDLPTKYKNKAKNARTWINNFYQTLVCGF